MFRLLGVVPGADFTIEAAATLSGSTTDEAKDELNRLATAHLIHQYAPGRYRFHDLLRLYAAERAHAEESLEGLAEAKQRLYDWYLLSVRAAVEQSHPHWARLPLTLSRSDVTAASFADLPSAAAWLTSEHRNLVAAIHQAVSAGPRQAVWLLTDAMRSHFWTGRNMGDWLSCAQAAVTVAGEEGDATARAAALLVLASAHTHRGQPDAISLYSQALSLADQGDWKEGMSSIRNNLAGTYLAPGATG